MIGKPLVSEKKSHPCMEWFYKVSVYLPILAALSLLTVEVAILAQSITPDHQENIAKAYYKRLSSQVEKNEFYCFGYPITSGLKGAVPRMDTYFLGVKRDLDPENLLTADRKVKPYEEIRQLLYPNYTSFWDITLRQSISWNLAWHYKTGLIGLSITGLLNLLAFIAVYLQNRRAQNALFPNWWSVILLVVGVVSSLSLPAVGYFDMLGDGGERVFHEYPLMHDITAHLYFIPNIIYILCSAAGLLWSTLKSDGKKSPSERVLSCFWIFCGLAAGICYHCWTAGSYGGWPFGGEMYVHHNRFEWMYTWVVCLFDLSLCYVFYKLNTRQKRIDHD